MRVTPDGSQPPQASASTNSATIANSSVTDGVSQEIAAASSVSSTGEKFLAPENVHGYRHSSMENQKT
jgi:hypothetical protein